MMFAVFFAFWRIMEIITLIPCMGMLAWFVDGFVKANLLTPNHILILFIVSVLALAWAMFTLFSYHRNSTNIQFVGLVDLAFVGTLIAAVYYLRFVTNTDCVAWNWGPGWQASAGPFFVSGPSGTLVTDKPCAMLKACFAFAIMNAIFFFFTSVLAWMHGGRMSSDEADRRHTHHSHRHSHRRRSGSHRSHRSSHSHHRVYV